MREPHGHGHFSSVGFVKTSRLVRRQQKNKTREVFRVVLDIFRENDTAILLRSTMTCDRRIGFIPTSEYLANTARGIFRRDPLEMRMGKKKPFALGKRHRMRGNGTYVLKRSARTTDQLVFDTKNCLRDNNEIAFQQQVVNSDNRTSQRIFHGDEQSVGGALGNGAEGGMERVTRHSGDFLAQQLHRGGFAESTGFALKRHAHFLELPFHPRLLALHCRFATAVAPLPRLATLAEQPVRWRIEYLIA